MVNGGKKALLAASIILLTGCSVGTQDLAENSLDMQMAGVQNTGATFSTSQDLSRTVIEEPQVTNTQESADYIVKTGTIIYETVDYKADKDELFKILNTHNVQVNSQEEYAHESYVTPPYEPEPILPLFNREQVMQTKPTKLKALNLTVQVPVGKIDALAKDLEQVATVSFSSSNNQNVTDQVLDVEGRIQSLTAKINRLEDLYKQAETMADIITIQTELETAYSEKEGYESQFSNLTQQVDDATYYITLNEVEELQDLSQKRYSFMDYLKQAVNQSGIAFIRVLEDTALLIVYLLPYLLIGGAGFALYKRRKRTKNNKDIK